MFHSNRNDGLDNLKTRWILLTYSLCEIFFKCYLSSFHKHRKCRFLSAFQLRNLSDAYQPRFLSVYISLASKVSTTSAVCNFHFPTLSASRFILLIVIPLSVCLLISDLQVLQVEGIIYLVLRFFIVSISTDSVILFFIWDTFLEYWRYVDKNISFDLTEGSTF